ncbi:MAG: chloride channel protein [Planctomycetaceae bacterium]|nr:chloride channel protein [Planctomycetaceae bacterium]
MLDWKASGKWTVLSVLVGVIAGLGGILFQIAGQIVVSNTLAPMAGYVPPEAKGEHATIEAHPAESFSPWMIVAVMTAGGLASGWLVYTFAPEAEGHGTDAAIDAFHNKRGVIRWHIPIVKTLASAITLGTGGSGGREGPIAQIGASFGSYLATALNLTARDRRILLAAGMGAGVGSIFRAPLAGALFAAEILYSDSDFEAEVFIPAATASIIGYSVFTMWLPEEIRYVPLFGKPETPFIAGGPEILIPYAVLALLLVLVGALYIKVFYGVHKLFAKLPLPKMVRPAIGAGLAGTLGVGLFFAMGKNPHALAVLSTGYGVLQEALTHPGSVGISMLLTVAMIKILTTSLTISSGGSGGVFGPSMVIGGCVGAAVGLAFQSVWPSAVPRPEAFGIVGMAGFFAGCAHAPFSTIIMVSEMTGGYGLLLPTMWVSTLTFLMGRPWKLYVKQVPSRLESPAHRGDFLVDVLEGIRVEDVYNRDDDHTLVPESATLDDIVHMLAETRQHYFPVVDANQKLIGIFSADDVRTYLYDETLWKLANARDVMNGNVVAVTPEDDLNTAMRCFTSIAIDELPVVDSHDRGRLLGTLRHKETIAAYNRRLMEFKRAAAEHQ